MALRNARDVYTRRQEGVSLWVVRASDITASSPDERTRSSTRRPTRSTATRRSTTCPRMSSTYESTTPSARPSSRPYALQLGDDALVYAQRLGEWISRAPQIEEDMALGNVGLDLLGQARVLLTRAG